MCRRAHDLLTLPRCTHGPPRLCMHTLSLRSLDKATVAPGRPLALPTLQRQLVCTSKSIDMATIFEPLAHLTKPDDHNRRSSIVSMPSPFTSNASTPSSNMAMMDPGFDNPAAQLLGDSELQAHGFRVLKELGVGLQGRVDLAVDTRSQIYVALKSPTFETQDFGSDQVDLLNMDCQVQSIIHERDAMRLVEHANVLQYIRSVHGMKNKHSYLILVMEYASNGDLFDLIGTTGALADHLAKFYFHQLILGLQACHASRVIHRDIKPENILFDQNFTLKLCDFGLASIVTGDAEDATLSDVEGTDLYIAPEMAMFSTFRATPVDVWACGVVLFIMLTGYPPFEQPEEGDLWYDHVVRGDLDAFWRAQPASIRRPSATAMALINRMMCVDPAKRITISEILAHPWLQDVSSIKEEAVVAQMHVLRRKCLEKAGLLDCDRRKRCSVM